MPPFEPDAGHPKVTIAPGQAVIGETVAVVGKLVANVPAEGDGVKAGGKVRVTSRWGGFHYMTVAATSIFRQVFKRHREHTPPTR